MAERIVELLMELDERKLKIVYHFILALAGGGGKGAEKD